MPKYFLTPHTFACLINGNAIFLDLKRNEYSAINAQDSASLHRLVPGWPAQTPLGQVTTDPSTDSATVVRDLLAQQLLTTDDKAGKDLQAPQLPPPAQVILPPERAVRVTFWQVVAFFRACVWAAWLLKFSSIERVVRRVQKRKRRAARRDVGRDTPSLEHLVLVFDYLRPFGLTSSKTCLLSSLALLEFMALYGVHPTWVFGVQLEPFMAHCWLQSERTVLNGSVQFVGDFIPIMAV